MVDPNRHDFPNRQQFFQFIVKNPPKTPKTVKKSFPKNPQINRQQPQNPSKSPQNPKLIVKNSKNPQKTS